MSKDELLPAVSSTLQSLTEQRRLEYSRSSIKLVDLVENKYPLADIIMSRYVYMYISEFIIMFSKYCMLQLYWDKGEWKS